MTGRVIRDEVAKILMVSSMSLVLLGAPGFAWAEDFVYQYDEFSWDLTTAATQITSQQLAIQSGFAATEAFGQHYKPSEEHYPVRILGVDLVMAMPPNGTSSYANADIEIWLDSDLDSATPENAQPSFSINTQDLYNTTTGEVGTPLIGGVASAINFDWDDPLAHPPIVYEGGIRVVVRFTEQAQDLSSEWNTIECSQLEGLLCGCQQVGVLFDSSITPKANFLNYLTPMGTCSGENNAWSYMEDLGIGGDIVMRLRADVADAGQSGDNTSPGDDDDTSGTDDTGTDDEDPIEEMTVAAVSPSMGFSDESTPVSITGSGFEDGATVTLGSTDLEDVEVVGNGLIRAVVPADVRPDTYMLVVANSGGESAFLVDAFEVIERVIDEGTGTIAPTDLSDSSDPAEEGCAGAIPPLNVALFGLWFMGARRLGQRKESSN